MLNVKASTVEAARWLGLNEALEHIRRVQNCTPIEAQRHLKAKIGDVIVPVKWGDSEGANDLPDPQYLQHTKLIVSGPGLAHDKTSDAYRPLRVLRSAVLGIWQNGKGSPLKELESAKHSAPSNKNKRMEWVTLVDAEEHIEIMQKCDSVEALRYLKEEVGDGVVAVKWADDPTDKPDVTVLKISEFVLTGPGFAPDGKDYRPLLVNSAQVMRYWPAPDGGNTLRPVSVRRVHSVRQGPKHEETVTKPRRKPHGKASEDSIRKAARKVYQESHSKPPNIEQAWHPIKKLLPNASRKRVREILNEPEFADQRLKAGDQSSRRT